MLYNAPMLFNLLTWAFAGLLIILTVFVHYETMTVISDAVIPWAQKRFRSRRVIAVIVASLLVGHIVEIWLFALGYWLLHNSGLGSIAGSFDESWNSYLFYATVNYTSLGANDLYPDGTVRNMTAAETLVGVMMISWSASFTYLKMEQLWLRHKKSKP